MIRLTTLLSALAVGAALSGAALALDAPTPTPSDTPSGAPTPAVSATPAMDDAAKKAKSSECYKEADAKNLHGKARRAFHRECMKSQ